MLLEEEGFTVGLMQCRGCFGLDLYLFCFGLLVRLTCLIGFVNLLGESHVLFSYQIAPDWMLLRSTIGVFRMIVV